MGSRACARGHPDEWPYTMTKPCPYSLERAHLSLGVQNFNLGKQTLERLEYGYWYLPRGLNPHLVANLRKYMH